MGHRTYTVRGMTCAHCVRSVVDEISAVDGVTDLDAAASRTRPTSDGEEGA